MIRHIALFRWTDGTTDAEVAAIAAALRRLPAAIPELVRYDVGSDEALAEGNWDFAVVADLPSAEAWATYTAHPAHQAVLVERIRPKLAERAAVQVTIPDPA